MTVIIRVNPAQIGPFQGFLKLSVGRGYEWGGVKFHGVLRFS